MAGKYHSPKEYQDAAKSPETPASELAFLAKSEYNFVRLAVVQNPNVTPEILASLVPENLDSWSEQEIARALTQNNGSNEAASWAPNGRHIVFSSSRGGRVQLYTMLADGTEQQPLTRDRGEASSPTWSPRPQ